MTNPAYNYAASIKSGTSDELVNTYFIRPLAGVVVRVLFHTPLTPNHVTILSTIVGCVAAYFYLDGTAGRTMVAGGLVTLKDILDSADGQLARAREQYSRRGRFLDSLGDILVNALVFTAITITLAQGHDRSFVFAFGMVAFTGITLRVSYHVFYHASFLHLQNSYNVNRTTEEIRPEDLQQDRFTLFLQRMFQLVYGWQDRLMLQLDRWCSRGVVHHRDFKAIWYGDTTGLRISGLLGLGTELFVLTLFSLFDRLDVYLYINVVVLNSIWVCGIAYRRVVLRRRLTNDLSHPREDSR